MGGFRVPQLSASATADTRFTGRHRKGPLSRRDLNRLDRRDLNRVDRTGPVTDIGNGRDDGLLTPQPHHNRTGGGRIKLTRFVVAAAAVIVALAAALIGGLGKGGGPGAPAARPGAAAPPAPGSYVGVYAPGVPQSWAGVAAFTAATGVRPDVVVYYSGWPQPFAAGFAVVAARHHAVPLVQMDPTGASVAAIAAGRYDGYLRSYAAAVRAFGGRVILSFGHEMNGSWYSWGYRHTRAAVFVAAWRHIVAVFRAAGAANVIWLWTVNVMQPREHILSPRRWWPGGGYVDWVGIDGYYLKRSWTFAALFGPTIRAVRALTLAPVLISETSAMPGAGKPAKIADLFAGVRAYGLLGFVWFNASKHPDWSINGPAAAAAFRRGARAYQGTAS